MEGFKLISRKQRIFCLLVSMICTAMVASAQQEAEFFYDGGRFFAATTADLNGDGLAEIIAVGQANRSDEREYSGLITVLAWKNNTLQKLSELSFNVVHEGRDQPTRIRAVEIIRDKNQAGWTLFTVGRGGADETGVGFLHQVKIKENELIDRGYQIFDVPEAEATHGYPLAAGDIDGDGSLEIIYGGFSSTATEDRADVQVFEIEDEGLSLIGRPFENLEVPIRVNALEADDVDGDGKAEIIIAGRTRVSEELEVSAFAWWSEGEVWHHVFEDKVQSRLRTVMIVDVNGDGKKELLTGGRIELGKLWLSDLRLWDLKDGEALPRDRFDWSLGHQIRMRTLTGIKDKPSHFNVGGRAEWATPEGEVRWLGFIWEFSYDQGHLKPILSPTYMDEGVETRVRHLHLSEWGDTVASGFSKTQEGKDRAFVRILSGARSN